MHNYLLCLPKINYSGVAFAGSMEAQVLLIPIFIVVLIPMETKTMRINRNSSRKTNGVNL